MKNVLIICQDRIGSSMAGPAIRCVELATSLSEYYKVTVAGVDIEKNYELIGEFDLVDIKIIKLSKLVQESNVVISQKINPRLHQQLIQFGSKFILDAYDPISIEGLELHRDLDIVKQSKLNAHLLIEQEYALKSADAILCASEKQKDFWIGALSAYSKIDPGLYNKDSSLRSLIDVVPFGIQKEKATKSGEGLREKFGIAKSDTVLLWGGGIWNWFDPLTLIKAIAKMSKTRADIKLVFMGLDHPNEKIPRMEMAHKAVKLSDELGLTNKNVFFNYGWVEYEKRANYFCDADFGVSMHFDHLETRFSFRTRMLDYLWADLPIIATQGDSFAEMIQEKNLGRVVRYENVDDIVNAINELSTNKKEVEIIKKNIVKTKPEFYWNNIIRPLKVMIEQPIDREKTHGKYVVLGKSTLQYASITRKYSGIKQASKNIVKTIIKI